MAVKAREIAERSCQIGPESIGVVGGQAAVDPHGFLGWQNGVFVAVNGDVVAGAEGGDGGGCGCN